MTHFIVIGSSFVPSVQTIEPSGTHVPPPSFVPGPHTIVQMPSLSIVPGPHSLELSPHAAISRPATANPETWIPLMEGNIGNGSRGRNLGVLGTSATSVLFGNSEPSPPRARGSRSR